MVILTGFSSLTDDLLIPRGSCGCRAGWALRIRSRLWRLLCLGLAAHGYSSLVMASAGGGSLIFFPVLDGNLGRRWWGLLPSGSQLSSFRSRCRSNWAERVAALGNVPSRRPAQLVFSLAGMCTFQQRTFRLADTAVSNTEAKSLINLLAKMSIPVYSYCLLPVR